MPAPEGNSNAMKFPTPDDRQALCKAYIDHVESGLSDECFPECDPQTLRQYVADFPVDFDTNAMERASRNRQLFWEKTGRDGTVGKIKGFNSRSWQFNMANRFDWRVKSDNTLKFPKDGAQDLADKFLSDVAESPKPADTAADAAKADQGATGKAA